MLFCYFSIGKCVTFVPITTVLYSPTILMPRFSPSCRWISTSRGWPQESNVLPVMTLDTIDIGADVNVVSPSVAWMSSGVVSMVSWLDDVFVGAVLEADRPPCRLWADWPWDWSDPGCSNVELQGNESSHTHVLQSIVCVYVRVYPCIHVQIHTWIHAHVHTNTNIFPIIISKHRPDKSEWQNRKISSETSLEERCLCMAMLCYKIEHLVFLIFMKKLASNCVQNSIVACEAAMVKRHCYM